MDAELNRQCESVPASGSRSAGSGLDGVENYTDLEEQPIGFRERTMQEAVATDLLISRVKAQATSFTRA